MADTTSPISNVAERYALSLFELALEAKSEAKVGEELNRLEALIESSDDLSRLIVSPVFSADDQFKAISALADKAGFEGLVANFLRVVAKNRRLFAIPGIVRAYRMLEAKNRGEVSAEVTSAHALSDGQESDLKAALKAVTGKDVAVHVTVDPSIMAGLIVKVGSRQIDTSLRSKLSSLKLALKEVG
ncbi:MAG: F0F1 ATP synthase subunit delta [Pseudomonadota bacterium]